MNKNTPNAKEFAEGAEAARDGHHDNPYAPHSTPFVAFELGHAFGDVAAPAPAPEDEDEEHHDAEDEAHA